MNDSEQDKPQEWQDDSGGFKWSRSLAPLDGVWVVIDWAGHRHSFDTEEDQLAFIERDMRMLDNHTINAKSDATDQITQFFQAGADVESEHGEQAVDAASETQAAGESGGGAGNRRSRRRARGASHGKKASS